MSYSRTFVLASRVLLACSLVCSLGLSAKAGDSGGVGSQKLAVVNVSKLFQFYDKVPQVQKKIDADHDAQKKQLDVRGKELVENNRKLSELYSKAQDSEDVFDAVQKLRKMQFIYERDVDTLNKQMQKDYLREMREVLSDIRQAIRAYAEENGFEMVLRSPDSDDPAKPPKSSNAMNDPAAADQQTYLQMQEAQSLSEVLERFNRNPVLFGAQAADITETVLSRLNATYAKRMLNGVK